MSTYTENINLALTPEETTETFLQWRTKINGDIDSNMLKIDAKIGELDSAKTLNIQDGEAEGSVQTLNSTAQTENSFAEGSETTAGGKCFTIVSASGTEDGEGTYVLDGVDGLEVGDVYSVEIGNNYDNYGSVVSINAETNTITVSRMTFGIEEFSDNTTFWIPVKPLVGTRFSGEASHAEGYGTVAGRYAAHSEGKLAVANGKYAHAEGVNSKALAYASHAEGWGSETTGQGAHSEGYFTKSKGVYSHSEGYQTEAKGMYDHAEGMRTTSGSKAFTIISGNGTEDGEGTYTLDSVEGLEVEDVYSIGNGADYDNYGSITAINTSNNTVTVDKWTIGNKEIFDKDSIFLIPLKPLAGTRLISVASHAEGKDVIAGRYGSHAEGDGSIANGNYAHAEGVNSKALAYAGHAEGWGSKTTGQGAHSEGVYTTADGKGAHSEGDSTHATGNFAHAEGNYNEASGVASHTEGTGTIAASVNQHAQGKFNKKDVNDKYAHIVGNGVNEWKRSNAHTLDWNGVGWFAGGLKVGGTGQDDANAVDVITALENSKPVSTTNTSLTVPANGSVTYTTLWNDALVGLTAYTDHELTVHSNYLGSDLYVTDIDDMGYIGTSIETGVIYDVIADVRPRVNQGMPYPTDGGELGLRFVNRTDTDIVIKINESRLNEELLKYLVTTGQHNADKVFPSVDTFWSCDSLSGTVSFATKSNNMVVTHERNIYYYDPSGEYSESPSEKIGICRDYVAVNQQSATNCTRYQWFKDFEGNEYYRELTSGMVTKTVNDDGSYTWTISNWTVSSDWERIDVSRDELAVKADLSDVKDMVSALDNGSLATKQNLNIPAGNTVTYKTLWNYNDLTSLKISADSNIVVTVGKTGGTSDWLDWGITSTVTEVDVAPSIRNQVDVGDSFFYDGVEIVVTIQSRNSVATTVAVEETRASKINTRLTALESNKKVPATYYNEYSSLDRISVEFTMSDTENCKNWVEFEQSVYNDPTGVVFNGEHFYGDLTSKYLVQPSSDIESSVITRSQIVTCEGSVHFNPSIYMRRGSSGITIVSQNEDGSYVCTSDNNWINTAWIRIDAETETPPTLTSVTTDGVAIGTDNWTGTGYFCTSSGTKYVVTHNVSTATSSTTASAINGFNRFCLKPAETTREWQNWTPYFTYNGVSYEFFYSPSRGLYEALIPATELTAAQVLTYIEWKHYAPTILNYGKLRALCYFDIKDTTSGTVTEERRWIASEPILRDTSGEITEEDYQKAQWFIGRDWWLELSSLDIASLSLIFLLMDVSGNGRIVNASALYLQNMVMGAITRLPIETIDNFS